VTFVSLHYASYVYWDLNILNSLGIDALNIKVLSESEGELLVAISVEY